MTPMKARNTSGFEIGDSIIVNPDVLCPDYSTLAFSGWQGWITDIDPEGKNLELVWDAIALRALPKDYIQESAQECLIWAGMILDWSNVSAAPERVTRAETDAVREALENRHRWDYLSDTNPGISELLADVDENDSLRVLSVWEEHLSRTLTFPFKAQRDESLFPSNVPTGTVVKVKGLAETSGHYGLMARVQVGLASHTLALCELEATDHESPNSPPLNDYVMWFANR